MIRMASKISLIDKIMLEAKKDLLTIGLEGIIARKISEDFKWQSNCLEILKYFECDQCGDCCRKCNVMVNLEEIKAITDRLKISFEDFFNRFISKQVNENFYYLKCSCPFLENRKGGKTICRIYEVRPRVCRVFPFSCDLCNVS
jgi:hypothetical protein